MGKKVWLYYPICGNKTRIQLRMDTVLENFPLFCPKCKREVTINVQHQKIVILKEPDALTQSR